MLYTSEAVIIDRHDNRLMKSPFDDKSTDICNYLVFLIILSNEFSVISMAKM